MATMSQMDHIIQRALRTCNNVMFRSQPALGKTTKIQSIANTKLATGEINVYNHFDGATLAPSDVVMSMPDMNEHTVRRLIDGRLPNAHTMPDAKGIIYVGEWMLMGLEVSKGFQKLVNHEELGGFRIPDGVIFVADGNREKDRSGAAQQSRAIMSRFTVFDLEYDSDYALNVVKDNYHVRVQAFLIRNPQLIDNYADVFENERGANDATLLEGKRGAWASLRSWAKVSAFLTDRDNTNEPVYDEEIMACVGSGVANTFLVFQQMLDNLTTIEEIIQRPEAAPVPQRMDECYALTTMLSLTTQPDQFKPVSVYMQRYQADLQTCFMKLMNDRISKDQAGLGKIRTLNEYKKWVTAPHITKMLQGAASVSG